jgi:hypothetical protein
VIREERFVLSKRQYAIDLGSLDVEEREGVRGSYWRFSFRAAWFRKQAGVLHACMGTLRGTQFNSADQYKDDPAVAMLLGYRDGRYGGECHARLSAEWLFWSEPQRFQAMMGQHEFLRRMLQGYPKSPSDWVGDDLEPYDAWWRFETTKELQS